MNRNFLPNMLILSGAFSQGTSGDYGGGSGSDLTSLWSPEYGWVSYLTLDDGVDQAGWYTEDGTFIGTEQGSDWKTEEP